MDLKENEVVESKPLEDDLDSWYDADDTDQSADYEEEEEDASPDSDSSGESPDTKVPEVAAESAVTEGTLPEPAVAEDPYAWVKELDSDLRAKVEALVHRDQSQRGRVAALQSRLDRLAAEQEARNRVATPSAAQKAVAGEKNIEEMDDDELRDFMERFPSVASNVEKLIERRIAKEREELQAQVRPIQEEALQARLVQQKEALRYNANHIFNTAETGIDLDDVLTSPRFKEWILQQPKGYQKFAREAESVEDATKVLVDFAQYTDEQVYRAWESTQGQAATGTQAPFESNQTADQTEARRQAALQGVGVPSRSAAVTKTGASDDYEAYFNQAVAEGGYR